MADIWKIVLYADDDTRDVEEIGLFTSRQDARDYRDDFHPGGKVRKA